MKQFGVRDKAVHSEKHECLLGVRDTGSHACYMIYGILKSGEKGKVVKPGIGHEEIVVAVTGDLEVTGPCSGTLGKGFAFHIQGDHECTLENQGEEEVVYIIAGGHSRGSGH
jgi:hypothetical protein